MIFEFGGKKYNNEQEIIDAGVRVVYFYCRDVKGRWKEIEHIIVKNPHFGYWYALKVIKRRYDPVTEDAYMTNCEYGSFWVKNYILCCVGFGNV